MKTSNHTPAKTRQRQSYGFPALFDELFNKDINRLIGHDYAPSKPAVNISEDDNGYSIELAAPGFAKKDLNIQVEPRKLIITGEKEVNESEETPRYNRREFGYSKFERSFTLPENANVKKITANAENGILTVSIAKLTDSEKGIRQVKIS